jgi:hypothetical protein
MAWPKSIHPSSLIEQLKCRISSIRQQRHKTQEEHERLENEIKQVRQERDQLLVPGLLSSPPQPESEAVAERSRPSALASESASLPALSATQVQPLSSESWAALWRKQIYLHDAGA